MRYTECAKGYCSQWYRNAAPHTTAYWTWKGVLTILPPQHRLFHGEIVCTEEKMQLWVSLHWAADVSIGTGQLP